MLGEINSYWFFSVRIKKSDSKWETFPLVAMFSHTHPRTLTHPSTIPHYPWVCHASVNSYHSVSTWSMQIRPLWSPVPAWVPILLGSVLLWPEPGAGLQHSTEKHTHITTGVIAFQPQGSTSATIAWQITPRHTKKRQGMRGGPGPRSSSNLCTVTSNASELLLFYSHWIWTKGREKERTVSMFGGGDGRKKETFRFFHLGDYDKWPGL